MLDLLTFRVIAGAVLASSLVVIYLANPPAVRHARRRYETAAIREVPRFLHALWAMVAIVIPLAAIILAAFLPRLVYDTWANVAFPGDVFVQVAGLGFWVAAAVLLVTSAKHLGRFMVVDIAMDKDHQLVTSGPYARIRHPAYTAVLSIGVAAALYMLNLLLVLSLAVTLVIAIYRVRLEEELLSSEEGFGSRYREYMERTGRFLPKLGKQVKRNPIRTRRGG